MTGKSLLWCTLASADLMADMLTHPLINDSPHCHSDLLLGKVQKVRRDITLSEPERWWNVEDSHETWVTQPEEKPIQFKKALKTMQVFADIFFRRKPRRNFISSCTMKLSKILFPSFCPSIYPPSVFHCPPLVLLSPYYPFLLFLLLPQVKKEAAPEFGLLTLSEIWQLTEPAKNLLPWN